MSPGFRYCSTKSSEVFSPHARAADTGRASRVERPIGALPARAPSEPSSPRAATGRRRSCTCGSRRWVPSSALCSCPGSRPDPIVGNVERVGDDLSEDAGRPLPDLGRSGLDRIAPSRVSSTPGAAAQKHFAATGETRRRGKRSQARCRATSAWTSTVPARVLRFLLPKLAARQHGSSTLSAPTLSRSV